MEFSRDDVLTLVRMKAIYEMSGDAVEDIRYRLPALLYLNEMNPEISSVEWAARFVDTLRRVPPKPSGLSEEIDTAIQYKTLDGRRVKEVPEEIKRTMQHGKKLFQVDSIMPATVISFFSVKNTPTVKAELLVCLLFSLLGIEPTEELAVGIAENILALDGNMQNERQLILELGEKLFDAING